MSFFCDHFYRLDFSGHFYRFDFSGHFYRFDLSGHFYRFDFCGRKELVVEEETVTDFLMEKEGRCDAFFMWWDLDMDMKGDVLLSCAPYWCHPNPWKEMQVN